MAHTKGKLIFDESVKVITFKKKKRFFSTKEPGTMGYPNVRERRIPSYSCITYKNKLKKKHMDKYKT